MSIKLIACDLDGTLLCDDKTIDKDTCNLLRGLQSKGIQLVLVTARRFGEVEEYINQLHMRENGSIYTITADGQYINDIQSNIVIEKSFLDETDINSILRIFSLDSYRIYYCDYLKDYILKKKLGFKHHIYNSIISKLIRNKRAFFLESTKLLSNNKIEKVVIEKLNYGKNNNLHIIEELKSKYDCCILDTGKIEIGACNVNKCVALQNIMDIFGFKNEEIVYFGDEGNDICCLTYFENSYAMGNASARVMHKAKHVTESNTQKGVFNVLITIFDMRKL